MLNANLFCLSDNYETKKKSLLQIFDKKRYKPRNEAVGNRISRSSVIKKLSDLK